MGMFEQCLLVDGFGRRDRESTAARFSCPERSPWQPVLADLTGSPGWLVLANSTITEIMSLKMVLLKLLPHLPGANELTQIIHTADPLLWMRHQQIYNHPKTHLRNLSNIENTPLMDNVHRQIDGCAPCGHSRFSLQHMPLPR